MASGASYAATAAAEPPDEPPGIRVRSHGLRLGPKAEFSVEEPMANSSKLVLPMMIAPACRSRLVTVDSYGGCQPARMREPQVVGMPTVVKRSLTATGTPASGPSGAPVRRRSSTSAAWASALSAATCRKACTRSSTAAIRSRCAWVTSVADTSPAVRAADSSAAVIRVSSMSLLLRQDPRHAEPLLLHRGRGRERLGRRQARPRLVVAVHVRQAGRVRGRRDAVSGDLLD